MLLRPACLEDAPAIARVLVDTWSSHRGQVPEEVWTKVQQASHYDDKAREWEQILREMAEGDSPGECVYLAEDEAGEIVGVARGGPTYTNENLCLADLIPEEIVALGRSGPPYAEPAAQTGEIYALYVRESHQRRGIGRRLVQSVAADLAETGRTSLLISCLAAGAPARRFYEALGGRVVGEREFEEEGVMLPGFVYGWEDTRALVATGRAEPNEGTGSQGAPTTSRGWTATMPG